MLYCRKSAFLFVMLTFFGAHGSTFFQRIHRRGTLRAKQARFPRGGSQLCMCMPHCLYAPTLAWPFECSFVEIFHDCKFACQDSMDRREYILTGSACTSRFAAIRWVADCDCDGASMLPPSQPDIFPVSPRRFAPCSRSGFDDAFAFAPHSAVVPISY